MSLESNETPPIVDVQTAPVAAAALPKFCRQCGAVWLPDWLECSPCAAKQTRPSASVALSAGDDRRAVTSTVALYFTLLLGTVVGIAAGALGARSDEIELYVSVGDSLLVLVWCALAHRDVAPALKHPPRVGWMAAGVGMALVTFAVATGALQVLTRVFHVPELQYLPSLKEAGWSKTAIIALLCLQPAVIEELAFRGFIFGALSRALRPVETIFVSSLMFMVLHLSPASFPHLLVIGLALGWLRHRTGTLWAGMAMHFTHNMLVVAAEWVQTSNGSA